MKKILTLIIAVILPIAAGAAIVTPTQAPSMDLNHIPPHFSSSSETVVMEWGCPVSEVVEADSGAEALRIIGEECLSEVKRAATSKPEVFEVIEASVIWPDVSVSEEDGGFRLKGTFFLETLVLQGNNR